MKKFKKKGEIVLLNGGYLSSKDSEAPMFNEKFVEAQKEAHFLVTFAEMAKGKDFVGKEAYDLNTLRSEVIQTIRKKEKTTYIPLPEAPKMKTFAAMQKEALAFVKNDEEVEKVNKINEHLRRFDVINEFETFGLFFEEEIVKLDKIYTMEEIIKAVTDTADLLEK